MTVIPLGAQPWTPWKELVARNRREISTFVQPDGDERGAGTWSWSAGLSSLHRAWVSTLSRLGFIPSVLEDLKSWLLFCRILAGILNRHFSDVRFGSM